MAVISMSRCNEKEIDSFFTFEEIPLECDRLIERFFERELFVPSFVQNCFHFKGENSIRLVTRKLG